WPGCPLSLLCFSSRDAARPERYPLSLHDALPIWSGRSGLRRCPRSSAATPSRPCAGFPGGRRWRDGCASSAARTPPGPQPGEARSEEHTSELQSRENLVCRLLLEKKKNKQGSDVT